VLKMREEVLKLGTEGANKKGKTKTAEEKNK
jgi:hypothetical protein